jgi:hypothetical protein
MTLMTHRFSLLRSSLAGIAGTLAIVLVAPTAGAAVESINANVEFVSPITLTEVNALGFGLLDVNLAAAQTIIISPTDVVTGTGVARIVGGVREAAEATVAATASQPITIIVGNFVDGVGYALSAPLCAYDGGAATACGGAGMSATSAASAALLVGATLTGNGSAAVGVDNGSFDVTVSYQ